MSLSAAEYATATESDIRYCFRLLLGREPHPEEWLGHSAQTGEALDLVVARYLSSLEFERRGLTTRSHSKALHLATAQGFHIYVATDDSDVGYHVARDGYEPDVTAVFRRTLRPGMSVIDIGANIGYFTMLSASLVGSAGHVLAIEPNPRNIRMLEASRRANGFEQVTPAQVAAGSATGFLVLHAAQSNGTTSAPPDDLDVLLGAETVPSLRVDALVDKTKPVQLIKLDVEGAEYNAILGCEETIARDRPTIISEFSPALMPGISGVSGIEYIDWLMRRSYEVACIRPDGSTSAPSRDPHAIMTEYSARSRDHIDILGTPA